MKTFRWTVPEPHHPPSPMGRSINADENEEIAALARRLELDATQERNLRSQLRGFRSNLLAATAGPAAIALYFLWLLWQDSTLGMLKNWKTQPLVWMCVILLIQSGWLLADALRRRRLKALMDKIADAKFTVESNQPTPCQ